MASWRGISFTAYDANHVKLPGLSPVFDSAVSLSDGASVLATLQGQGLSAKGSDGWHYATPDLTALVTGSGVLVGKAVRYSVDLGANSGAEQRYLDGEFRAEDWNLDNCDVASSTLATAAALAVAQTELDAINATIGAAKMELDAVKAKTDLIASNGSATLSVLAGSGAVGPLLSVPQNQAWTTGIAAKNPDGSAMDLTGKSLIFEFGLGVAGGGSVTGAKPTVLFARVGTLRSPSTLGIADVALVPADTVALAAGAGYVYAAKVLDGGGNLVVYVFTESPATLLGSPPGG